MLQGTLLGMEWPQENRGINARDFEKVFDYEAKPTPAITLTSADTGPQVEFLETDEQWKEWLSLLPNGPVNRDFGAEKPGGMLPLASESSGLYLILARRTGETWVEPANNPKGLDGIICSPNDSLIAEKHSIKVLPFSDIAFKEISQCFCIHGSISRVINRSDVPVFASAEVEMEYSLGTHHVARIYNCRSSNVWGMDLALTVTHFPHSNITFAIMYGCSLDIARDVLRRLSIARTAINHPLILPAIFAELERSRHLKLVESTMDDIEQQILGLNFQLSAKAQRQISQTTNRNRAKQNKWLDTIYLRNDLTSWGVHLSRMAEHVDAIQQSLVKKPRCNADESSSVGSETIGAHAEDGDYDEETIKIGAKIKQRLQVIIDEYNDKIRECTMRVDGMAIAAQWADNEANVEIALATRRDSEHMRSIAIVTMVFLPGTFFAGVFSMSFFDWNPSNPDAMVSSYLWIYVTITAITTALVLGLWYYFAVWRRSLREY